MFHQPNLLNQHHKLVHRPIARPKFVLAVEASLAPVPPLAMAKSVPDQSPLFTDNVPPNVKLPVEVTVPVRVSPLIVPVADTDVTEPPEGEAHDKVPLPLVWITCPEVPSAVGRTHI